MYPILFQKGPVTVYSYGVMIAIACLVVVFLTARDAKSKGIPVGIIQDLAFWVILTGVFGARLLYVSLNLNYYLKNPLEIIMLNHGGLVFLGGFVPAIIVAVLYVKSKKLDVALLANICAPYVPLGHAIGRIGCFLNGCCYGKAADLPWSVFMDGANRHPSQIYSSLFNFGIFGILLAIRNKKWASGVRLIFIYMFLYGTGRFIVEFFRGDKVDVFGVFRISQWISIGMILFSVIAYYISCRTFLLTTNNTNCTNKKK